MSPTPATRRPRCAAILTTLTVAAAFVSTALVAARIAPSTATSAPGLEQFSAQVLSWGDCAGFPTAPATTSGSPARQCAYLLVPLDYTDPDGRMLRIGLLRTPASDPGRRLGSLVINPGGPGLSGMAAAADLADQAAAAEVGQRFDIVGFDPRGIGSSAPQVRCQPGATRDAQRAVDLTADPTPAGVARLEEQERADNAACATRTGADILAHIGTREVVQDLDILRAALGDPKLTYLGYSYGTRIGTAYAEAFPAKVRAMILDGAIDPAQDPAGRTVDQAAAAQREFDAYAADCARTEECPVGDQPGAAVPSFQSLTRPLLDEPLAVGDGRLLTFDDAVAAVSSAVLDPQLWPRLTAGLRELAQGRGEILLAQADAAAGRSPDGTYDPTAGAATAIQCVDDPPVTDPVTARDIDARIRAAAPFQDSGRGPSPALDHCAFWPVPPTSAPHHPAVTGLPVLLVISTIGDPITPYPSGVHLALDLRARLLTFGGAQHTVGMSTPFGPTVMA